MQWQSCGPQKVVVRLEHSPQGIVPIPTRFINVELAELLKHLPTSHLRPAV